MKLTFPKTQLGTYALPKLEMLGRLFKLDDPYGADYGKVLEELFKMFPKARDFYNYRKGEMGPEYLRIRDADALKKWENQHPGDFLILRVDLNKYKGKSVNTARVEEKEGYFLHAFQVACILLQDPEVLKGPDWEGIDCAGDDYNWRGYGFGTGCPCFRFDDGQLGFDAGWSGAADQGFGSAVAFGSVAGPSSLDSFDPSALEVRINSKEYVATDRVMVNSIENISTEELLEEVKRRIDG